MSSTKHDPQSPASALSPTLNKAGIPIQPSSTNYTDAKAAASKPYTPEIKIPDGRRNSFGEVISSPTETWRPRLDRTQSWNREDLKRVVYKGEMVDGKEGQGEGFTEVEHVFEERAVHV